MLDHSKRLVTLTQSLTPVFLKRQISDITSPNFGDIMMEPKGFCEPLSLHIPIANFIGVYYHPDSPFYRDAKLIKKAVLFMDVMLANLNDDGTMDLKETNFHDATATAFAITPIAYAYRLIQKEGAGTGPEKALSDKMMDFFIKGAEGMRMGGFHTPNHRWVMTAALSLMYNILDNPIYKEEALKYLNEGIDCDAEGEYTERSSAIYDIAVNESLITTAEELDMPELLEHVKRNMQKNFTLLEPDGTICTINSIRQDYSTRYLPLRHYWTVLYLAHKFNDPFFAYFAERLLSQMEVMKGGLTELIFTGGKEDVHNPVIQFLLDESLSEDIKADTPEWGGEWFYEKNKVVRWRSGDSSLTLVCEREVFLKYETGENTMHLKIGSCFFGKGYFSPESIVRTTKGYRMEAETLACYYKPFDKKPESSAWKDMPRELRETVHTQKQKITVDVVHGERTKVKVRVDGVHGVPVKVEMVLRKDGKLDTGSAWIPGNAGSWAILKEGSARYQVGQDTMLIEGGAFSHWYTANMRGTAPSSKEDFTLYMTGFAPFEHEFYLSAGTDTDC